VLCEPRIAVLPSRARHAGAQITAVAKLGGIELDETQQYIAAAMSGIGDDGKWAAFEFGLYGPRQGGKTEVLIARLLFGLYVAREDFQVYSSHAVKTSTKMFKRLKRCVDRSPHLGPRIARVSNRVGAETLELTTGQVVECVARSTSSGRGFTASTLLWDEAHEADPDQMGAQMPMLSTIRNPQVVYAMSFADEGSLHVAGVRERALTGKSGVGWLEWSMHPDDDVADRRVWAACNPAVPSRISWDYLEREYQALGPERFARERLGRSDWPTGRPGEWQVMSRDAWEACASPGVLLEEPFVLAAVGAPAPSSSSWEAWPDGIPPWLQRV
jgi:hypothetical protein